MTISFENHNSNSTIKNYFFFFSERLLLRSESLFKSLLNWHMKKTKFHIYVILTALLLTSAMATSAFAVTVPTFTLSSQSYVQFQYVLPQGTTFNGSISTTGSVRFFISAPNGTIISNLGIIDKSATFGFVSQQNGTYTLNFENDLPNSIQVTFSYATNPEITQSGNSALISPVYLLIVVVVAVVGSFLIIFFTRRKSKVETFDANIETSTSAKRVWPKANSCLK